MLLLSVAATGSLHAQDAPPPPPPPPPPAKKEAKPAVAEPEFVDMVIEDVPFEEQRYGNNINPDLRRDYNTTYCGEETIAFYPKDGQRYQGPVGLASGEDVLLPMIFSSINCDQRNTNVRIVSLSGAYGLFNLSKRRWDVPLAYQMLAPLSKGTYAAKRDEMTGVIDARGETILDLEYNNVYKLYGVDNYVGVKVGTPSRTGIVSILSRKATVPPVYKELTQLGSTPQFIAQEPNKGFNVVDINNRPVFDEWYDKLSKASGRTDYIVAVKDGLSGMLGVNGEVIIPLEYVYFEPLTYGGDTYLAQNKDGKYGCLALTGEVKLPFSYDAIDQPTYGGGSAAISTKDGKCGIISTRGGVPVEIATCEYSDILATKSVFIVKKRDKYGLLDLKGEPIANVSYDSIATLSTKLLAVESAKGWQLMSTDGTILTDDYYSALATVPMSGPRDYYRTNNFSFLKGENAAGKTRILDETGNVITDFVYDDILGESDNIIVAAKGGKVGIHSLIKRRDLVPYEYDQIVAVTKGGLHYVGIRDNEYYSITTEGEVEKL